LVLRAGDLTEDGSAPEWAHRGAWAARLIAFDRHPVFRATSGNHGSSCRPGQPINDKGVRPLADAQSVPIGCTLDPGRASETTPAGSHRVGEPQLMIQVSFFGPITCHVPEAFRMQPCELHPYFLLVPVTFDREVPYLQLRVAPAGTEKLVEVPAELVTLRSSDPETDASAFAKMTPASTLIVVLICAAVVLLVDTWQVAVTGPLVLFTNWVE
jgi:hypothetical protein